MAGQYLHMFKMLKVLCLLAVFINNAIAQTDPHIVFVMADDMGWHDVGYHGSEIKTPHIDALANDGVRLERYYVGPTCGPTRSQFLSGRYTINLGLQGSNNKPCTKEGIPTRYPTIADRLKQEGYATHLIGKWHAGFHTTGHLPTNRGFDTFRGFLLASGDHYTHLVEEALDYHNNTSPYNNSYGVYSTDAFTTRAQELIGNHDTDNPGKSMFMYLSYQAPHTPLQLSQNTSFENLYGEVTAADRKSIAAMITAMDDGVGKVVQALKDANMYDNTVIIFSSDNGGLRGTGSSYPLRGSKKSYFDGGVRAVGFVSSELIPKRQRNRDVTDLMHVTDWLPTMVEGIAGGRRLPSRGELKLDGHNQWNTIRNGAPTTRQEIVFHIALKKRGSTFDERITAAMIKGQHKIMTGIHIENHKWPKPSLNYTVWENESKSRGHVAIGTQIFNIYNDEGEDTDLSSNTILKEGLLATLKLYQRTMLPRIHSEMNTTQCQPPAGGVWGPWTV